MNIDTAYASKSVYYGAVIGKDSGDVDLSARGSVLESRVEQLNIAASRLEAILVCVQSLNDRLFGCSAELGSKVDTIATPPSSSAIQRFDGAVERLERVARSIEVAVSATAEIA